MYRIQLNETMSKEFLRCWNGAGVHLQSCVQDNILGWIKAEPFPPFLEHFSFRIGNQVFFIKVVDVEAKVIGPGNPNGFRIIANEWNGHACVMPMRRFGVGWKPCEPGWGLLNPDTGKPINPLELVSDEKIEMTNWELQDFGVQIVRDHIRKNPEHKIMSSNGNPDVQPSIWFVGDDGPEWVVVRVVRYPEKRAKMPTDIADIAKNCSQLSDTGHFASVAMENPENVSDPLWRGYATHINFEGLEPIIL